MRMTFGKHKGLPACDVPLDYLIWCTESMPRVPQVVMDELKRRSAFSAAAGQAVSSLMFLAAADKKKKVRRWRKLRKRRKARAARRAGESSSEQK